MQRMPIFTEEIVISYYKTNIALLNVMHWQIDIYNLFCRPHVNHGLVKKRLKAFMRKCLLAKNIKSSGHWIKKKQMPTFPRLVICMRLAATDDLSHSGETAASGSNSP